jgi:pilus assembly protein CpaB
MIDATNKWLLGAGAVLALLVGVAVYLAITTQGLSRGATVVVARQTVPERTQFTAANITELLATRELPADAVPQGALSRPGEAVGKVTTTQLAAGEVVLGTPNRLVGAEGEGARPAAAIPRDKVALAIAANESVTIAGAVQPGDRVDVIATWNRPTGAAVTQDIFQDVRVFAVGRWQGETRVPVASGLADGGPPTTVTLLLDYQQAVVLEYLMRTGGHISLALRRFDQASDVPTEPITPDSVRRYFGVDGTTP